MIGFALVVAIACTSACKGNKASKGRDAGAGDGGIDPTELAGKLDKQCVAGNLEACRALGVMYAEGVGVSPDPKRAIGKDPLGIGQVADHFLDGPLARRVAILLSVGGESLKPGGQLIQLTGQDRYDVFVLANPGNIPGERRGVLSGLGA